MKIIHVCIGKANPDRMNGVNRSVNFIANHQVQHGLPVEVWGITGDPNAPTPERNYTLKLFQARKNHFLLAPYLIAEINKLPTDSLVHFQGALIVEYFSISRLLKKRGIMWVVTPRSTHSPDALKRNWLAKKIYIMLFESRFLRDAAAVQALAIQEGDWVSEWVDKDKIKIIPNGESLESTAHEFSLLEKKHSPVFSFCGRIENYQKGLDLFIPAFIKYLKTGGTGELWLVGDGVSKTMLSRQVEEAGLGDRVKFLGPLFGEKKLNYLSNSDVFVHPSRWEGISRSILEALALKRPLLISEGTNMASEVRQARCGVVFKSLSEKHLVEGLFDIEQHHLQGDLEDMGARSLGLMKSNFDMKVVTERIFGELYNNPEFTVQGDLT